LVDQWSLISNQLLFGHGLSC